MTTQFYIVRHGETEWNKDKIVQGHKNSVLSSTGKKQAKYIGEKLKDYDFDVIYSSDLVRALDTAKYINKYHNQVIVVDKMLRERKLGVLEGNNWETINSKYPEAGRIYHSDSSTTEIPGGGESKQQFSDRVKAYMDKIAVQEEGKKVLIITHGWFISYWMKQVLNVPLKEKGVISYVENGSISKFRYRNGKWLLEKFNA